MYYNTSVNKRIVLIFLAATNFVSLFQLIKADDQYGNDILGLSVAETIRLRQYIAEEHHVTTTDGYIIQLVRMLNPLINEGKRGLEGKKPVLMIHGIEGSGALFVSNSIDARPKDYTKLNVSQISEESLNQLLSVDPNSNSLAMLSSCFGHEVWLMNRRGARGSLGHVNNGSTKRRMPLVVPALEALERTFKFKFWNYSFDEQVKYDIPEVIDYILETTGESELTAVGHSAGGALLLMSLADQVDLADKISKVLLWAPAIYPGQPTGKLPRFSHVAPLHMSYIGPIIPLYLLPFLQGLITSPCQIVAAQQTICLAFNNQNYGDAGNQQDLRPGLMNQIPSATSSHEYAQLGQAEKKGKMFTYDHGSGAKNKAAYGQQEPILYDVSKIKSRKMSFWYGNTDIQVAASNIERAIADLTVSAKKYFFNDTNIKFNHMSFFLHKNVSQLLNIPSLREIEGLD